MSGILRRFGYDQRATAAMIFGISLIPCLGAVGIAVDYMRADMAHNKLQTAVDSAALAAGASDLTSDADLSKLITNYVDVNSSGMKGFEITKVNRSTNDAGDVIVNVKGKMKTAVMRIFGIDELNLAATTRVSRSGQGRAEIALVLDTTGSMSGTKISNLKSAAKTLIDGSLAYNTDPSDPLVKIGIVPFAQYVNVGVSRRNESWIDVPDDYQTTSTSCHYHGGKLSCTTKTTDHTFNGCVGSRDYPYNLQDDSYSAQPVPGLMDVTCSNELTDLTTDQTTLDDAIDALSASGNTYIGAGLTWGWRLVSPDAPFDQGISYEDAKKTKTKTKKFVVLMTDGQNTRAPSYPEHNSSDSSLADTLTKQLCTNIKALDIQVFTVAFQVTDTSTLGMLQDCASSPSYAFDASDGDALVAAFKSVSDKIAELRIAE